MKVNELKSIVKTITYRTTILNAKLKLLDGNRPTAAKKAQAERLGRIHKLACGK